MEGITKIAILPMRHISQRVKGKNYRLLGAKPLYEHILETLLNSGEFSAILVDTDSPIIIENIHAKYLSNPFHQSSEIIHVFKRPDDLIAPEISMNVIIQSVLSRYQSKIQSQSQSHPQSDLIIFQTHATNPFLSEETVKDSLMKYLNLLKSHYTEPKDPSLANFPKTSSQHQTEIPTMMGVRPYQKRLWTRDAQPVNHKLGELLQTQDLPILYEENSCLYIFTNTSFRENNYNRLGSNIHFYEMSDIESMDIDTEADFKQVEAIYRFRQREQQSRIKHPSPHSDHEILEHLKTTFKTHIKAVEMRDTTIIPKSIRILISAPYMMPNIGAFVQFFHLLDIEVIVADVQERLTEEELEKYHGQYDIALIGDDAFTKNILKNSGVKALCKWGTGIDSIDQKACTELNILLKNTPDAFSIPVAESVMASILSLTRQTYQSTNLMSYSDEWVKLPCRTLDEYTIGIIGYGNVGMALGKLLEPFIRDKTILAYDIDKSKTHSQTQIQKNPKIQGTDTMEELLTKSNIVVICCDFREGNLHLMNKRTINLMPKNSYLINMARGRLVHEKALTDALLSGHLQGASLDVFEDEPLPETSLLRRLPNVLLSAHNANSSPKAWLNVHTNTIRNCLFCIDLINNK